MTGLCAAGMVHRMKTAVRLWKVNLCLLAILGAVFPGAIAADLEIRVDNPPAAGRMIVQVFKSANAFVDIRDPYRSETLAEPGKPVIIRDLPAGEYAVMVYNDENGNGQLDRNFIGIPREPMGFSNSYWPQGPPAFVRAVFRLEEGERKPVEIHLQSVFGKFGLFSVGVGVVGQSSPYRGYRGTVAQVIPAISYMGDRLQIFGPAARFGLCTWSNISVAATMGYRIGAYEEEDSDALAGLGDRDDTLMGGAAVRLRLPKGVDVSLGYEHDLLDRTGGGVAHMDVSKAFQVRGLTFSPHLGLRWLDAEIAGYEFGVPAEKADEGRPAYQPGDALNLRTGLNVFTELPGDWVLILNGGVEFLADGIKASPLVEGRELYSFFAAVNRRL